MLSRGEDRIEFKNAMDKLGIEMAKSAPAYSVEEALKIAEELGYPCVIRPAYTMGGTGGGIVYNEEELKSSCKRYCRFYGKPNSCRRVCNWLGRA